MNNSIIALRKWKTNWKETKETSIKDWVFIIINYQIFINNNYFTLELEVEIAHNEADALRHLLNIRIDESNRIKVILSTFKIIIMLIIFLLFIIYLISTLIKMLLIALSINSTQLTFYNWIMFNWILSLYEIIINVIIKQVLEWTKLKTHKRRSK